MTYLEGEDYWVRYLDFPNMASPSLAASNGDGTFTIFVNTRFGPEQQRRGLEHELKHLEEEHFYRDYCPIGSIETAADGGAPAPAPAPPVELIREFGSLEALKQYIFAEARGTSSGRASGK